MNITVWGSRGSLPSPGPETTKYGGNTSCVQVMHKNTCIILDGGSGIQRLGANLSADVTTIHILLTHLHLDHIMGLGFFRPFYNPSIEINLWGPTGFSESLQGRLRRYFSPPLFPVRLYDLPCKPNIIEINQSTFTIGDITINSEYVCHPGPTVGYRLDNGTSVFTYIPDHEPALGASNFPNVAEWTSGYDLAKNADLLFHDAQYKNDEYKNCIGWGHSSMEDAIKFARLSEVKKVMFFHHDPTHSDKELESLHHETIKNLNLPFETGICAEGSQFYLPG